ncbi:MAG: type II toxin-antitoxin system Phd/YefM family antitoxin [Synergistaceae bacterium]|nr:type II toxin-antitoxin system Phd/YefM family antitoxin [Synergistaceae bacterium]
MTATTLTRAQKNLAQLVSDVNENGIPVIIAADNGENAVLVSEDEWNSMQETLYLYSIPGMVESIKAAEREPLSECRVYNPNEEW